jgi:hypothetical protein
MVGFLCNKAKFGQGWLEVEIAFVFLLFSAEWILFGNGSPMVVVKISHLPGTTIKNDI